MAYAEIDVQALKTAVDAVLDHLVADLNVRMVRVEDGEDFYWHCPASELFDMSKNPAGLDVGRLSDDMDFVKLIRRGEGGDISYNLVHIAPLLRYIAEKVKE